jgi:hypothetical protein
MGVFLDPRQLCKFWQTGIYPAMPQSSVMAGGHCDGALRATPPELCFNDAPDFIVPAFLSIPHDRKEKFLPSKKGTLTSYDPANNGLSGGWILYEPVRWPKKNQARVR